MTEVLDLETERLDREFSDMDDEELVAAMISLLASLADGRNGSLEAKVCFLHVAGRWIPNEVFAEAVLQTGLVGAAGER